MPAKSNPRKAKVKPVESELPKAPLEEQASVSAPVSPPVVESTEKDLEQILDNESGGSTLERKNSVLFTAGIFVLAGIVIATAIVFVIYLGTPKVVGNKPPVAKESRPVMRPTPTISVRDISFEVLNGSGIAGAAGKAANQLSSKGYSVVSVGNTKKTAASEVFVSSSLTPKSVSLLLADVFALFGVGSSSGTLTGSTAAARLVIGVK